MLRNRWAELRLTELSVEAVSKRLRDYTELLEQSGAWKRQWDTFQSRKSHPQLVENLSKEVELIIEWYAARFVEMDEYFGTTTDWQQTSTDMQPRKMLRDGQLLIERQGCYYDMQGMVYFQ